MPHACLLCSHSDDSDQGTRLPVSRLPVSGSFGRPAEPTLSVFVFFSACLLLVCHWPCCVMLRKDLKGQAAFREWSAGKAGRSCEMPLGKGEGVEYLRDGLYLHRKSTNAGRKSSFLICQLRLCCKEEQQLCLKNNNNNKKTPMRNKSDDSWKIVLLHLTDFTPPCVGVKAT